MEAAAHLLGRAEEQRRIAAVVSAARNGLGGALLLEGEPGIGKTALLEAATAERAGVRLLRADGFEAESTLPYAALQRLMIPLRDYLPALPERHQQALRVAAGVAAGPPPDRFLVGLGVLGLLAAAGEDTPVVCAVDDAHLLDSESLDALALVARRLGAESAALVLASREARARRDPDGRSAAAAGGRSRPRRRRSACCCPRCRSPSTRRPRRRSPSRPAATRWP